jgi:hypothetical protein
MYGYTHTEREYAVCGQLSPFDKPIPASAAQLSLTIYWQLRTSKFSLKIFHQRYTKPPMMLKGQDLSVITVSYYACLMDTPYGLTILQKNAMSFPDFVLIREA